jgi:hypothetical protein
MKDSFSVPILERKAYITWNMVFSPIPNEIKSGQLREKQLL